MPGDVEEDLLRLSEARCGQWLADRWHLGPLLGIGGTSAVYEATHRNGRRVAIKLLHPQWALMPTVRKRFLREGYISNQVDHPAVAAVLDDGETSEGDAYLVLELLEGEPLSATLKRERRLDLGRALSIAERLLEALAEAHDKGVVHRDIKPENIMLLGDGSLKILDFGIASIKTTDPSATLATLPGSARGTPAYMAPEQALGQQVDARADLWAVGAVLYRALSGQPVRGPGSTESMLVQAATQPIRPVRQAAPALSPGLAAVIDRALCFEPSGRFPDADSMLDALRSADSAPAAGDSTLPEGSAVPALPPAALPDLTTPEAPAISALSAAPVASPLEPPRATSSPPTLEAPAAPAPAASSLRSWALLPIGAALGLLLARSFSASAQVSQPPAPSAAQVASSAAPSAEPQAPAQPAEPPPPQPLASAAQPEASALAPGPSARPSRRPPASAQPTQPAQPAQPAASAAAQPAPAAPSAQAPAPAASAGDLFQKRR